MDENIPTPTIPTANIPTPSDDPKKLDDEELGKIVGGQGFWDHSLEDYWNNIYQTLPETHPYAQVGFENFLQSVMENEPDMLTCRNAWIAAGKPDRYWYYIGSDGVLERRRGN